MNKLLSAALLCALTADATAMDAAVDHRRELPVFGSFALEFDACSADSHKVKFRFKIGNFSPMDLQLPVETDAAGAATSPYVWATLEELKEAAARIFPKEFDGPVGRDSDAAVSADSYLQDLALSPVQVSGGDGIAREISFIDLVLHAVKEDLAGQELKKYSAIGIDYRSSSAVLDPAQTCASAALVLPDRKDER